MQLLNNHILIDVGHYGSYFNRVELGGRELMVDTSYNGYEYLRRSGKVIEVPKQLTYNTIPHTMDNKVLNVQVEKGDLVFFSAKAFQYCKDRNLIIAQGESTLYVMPYRYLICAIKPDNRVQMLNGKVLIKMRPDIKRTHKVFNPTESDVLGKLYIPDEKRTDAVYRFAEITHVDNNENYQGYTYDTGSPYELFTYRKQNLEVGDIVAINKYSDFDLQSVFKETTEHDELEKSFVVDRPSIVCYQKPDSKEFKPYGFYFTIKPDKRETTTSNGLVYSQKQTVKTRSGLVDKVGCAVPMLQPHDRVRISEKSELTIDGKEYIHHYWMLMKVNV